MPEAFGPLGSYRVAALCAAVNAGLAGDSWFYFFRWTDTTRLGLIRGVYMDVAVGATAFAAGLGKFEMKRFINMTDSGAGGTSLTLTGNAGKLRSSMGTPLSPSIRIISAAALTVATGSGDGNAMGYITAGFPATAGVQIVPANTPIFERKGPHDHPLVLAQNEGFGLRCTVPATGVWTVQVTVDWAEVAEYG